MTRPYQILLLEDEPLLREMLALYLASRGYEVITAGSRQDGEAVVQALGWEWPDLVLADANLGRDPDLYEGYRFLAHWQAWYPVPHFVFMHGHPRSVHLPGEEEGRVSHISKPFHPPDLLLLIRSILPEADP